MKHSIINELYNCDRILSILEFDGEVVVQIEVFSKSEKKLITEERFSLSKENLHSFIGVLLHVQSKMKGGKNG
jgi:hypothetical protein